MGVGHPPGTRGRKFRPWGRPFRETGAGRVPGIWNFAESFGRLARVRSPYPARGGGNRPGPGGPVTRGECEWGGANGPYDSPEILQIRVFVGFRTASRPCALRGISPPRGHSPPSRKATAGVGGRSRFASQETLRGRTGKGPPPPRSGQGPIGRSSGIPGRCGPKYTRPDPLYYSPVAK